jgi:hypothetical protein
MAFRVCLRGRDVECVRNWRDYCAYRDCVHTVVRCAAGGAKVRDHICTSLRQLETLLSTLAEQTALRHQIVESTDLHEVRQHNADANSQRLKY